MYVLEYYRDMWKGLPVLGLVRSCANLSVVGEVGVTEHSFLGVIFCEDGVYALSLPAVPSLHGISCLCNSW